VKRVGWAYVESVFPPVDPNAMTHLLAVLLSIILALTITAGSPAATSRLSCRCRSWR